MLPARSRNKDDLEIHDYLSQVLIQQNELTDAYDELRKLADAQPDNQQIFIRMANVAYMMEDYVAMGDACEKALLIDREIRWCHISMREQAKGRGMW